MLSGMLKREFAMASGVLCERLQAAARETGGKLSTSIGEHCKSQCCGKWVQYFYVLAFDTGLKHLDKCTVIGGTSQAALWFRSTMLRMWFSRVYSLYRLLLLIYVSVNVYIHLLQS